ECLAGVGLAFGLECLARQQRSPHRARRRLTSGVVSATVAIPSFSSVQIAICPALCFYFRGCLSTRSKFTPARGTVEKAQSRFIARPIFPRAARAAATAVAAGASSSRLITILIT